MWYVIKLTEVSHCCTVPDRWNVPDMEKPAYMKEIHVRKYGQNNICRIKKSYVTIHGICIGFHPGYSLWLSL